MKTHIILFLFLLMSGWLFAQEVQVSFQDGQTQIKVGTAWKAINIGDRLAADATVKLDKGASLELQIINATITINQAGTYMLKDILAARKQADTNGVAKSLKSTFTAMIGAAPVKNQSTVAGARASNKSDEDKMTWVSSDTDSIIDSGKSLLQAGKIQEAQDKFNEAMLEATDEEIPQIQYLIGYNLAVAGDIRGASKQWNGLVPDSDASWAADFVLLKARLLEESFAWTDAITLLTKQGANLANDVNRGPIYHFMLGLAWQNTGNSSNAKAAYTKVVSLVPNTDLGKAAAALLKN